MGRGLKTDPKYSSPISTSEGIEYAYLVKRWEQDMRFRQKEGGRHWTKNGALSAAVCLRWPDFVCRIRLTRLTTRFASDETRRM